MIEDVEKEKCYVVQRKYKMEKLCLRENSILNNQAGKEIEEEIAVMQLKEIL